MLWLVTTKTLIKPLKGLNRIMSEKQTNSPEVNERRDTIQFNDGSMAIGTNIEGSVFRFAAKYKEVEASPEDVVLVKTKSGKRYALGRAVIAEMPELDVETGQFGEPGQKLRAKGLHEIPAGLKDITIGQPWETLGGDDPVVMAMHEYKVAAPGSEINQVDMPSPFPSAKEHLNRVEQELVSRNRL